MPNIFNIELPPYAYLMQVLNHSSKSAATYIEIWRHKDKQNKIKVAKNDIRDRFLIPAAKFRNDLLVLVKEGLVSVDQTGDDDWYILNIEVIGWGDE